MRAKIEPRKATLATLFVALMVLAPLATLTITAPVGAEDPPVVDPATEVVGPTPTPADSHAADDPFWTTLDGFSTKTGYRMVFLWEAAEPVAGVVQWGFTPDSLDRLAVPLGNSVDTAQMAYMEVDRAHVLAGLDVYWRVLDQASGALSPINSFRLGNAWNSDVSDGVYEVNAVLQLDAKSLPDDVPSDTGLQDLALAMDIFAERVWDATDGHIRIGKVLITDTAANYPAYQPSGPGICAETQTANGVALQHTLADFVVQTTIPFDSHTWGGGTPVIDDPCTAFYIGRIGQLVIPWVDDAHLGYVMTHEFAHYALGAPDLYNTENVLDTRGCANRDPNHPGYDVSVMHNSGGWTGQRWDLTEFDRDFSDCDRSVGSPEVTWDEMRTWYPTIPETTAADIDHDDSDPFLKRGNPDGGQLDVYVMSQLPGASAVEHFIKAPRETEEEGPQHMLSIDSPANGTQVPPTAVDIIGNADRDIPANLAPDVTLQADPDRGDAPVTVTFTLGASDPDGSIASWTLDYGDGSAGESGTGSAPPSTLTHTYGADGVYFAYLNVTDDEGDVGQALASITVGGGQAMRIGTDASGDAPTSGSCHDIPCDHAWTAGAADGLDLVEAHVEDVGDDIRFSWRVVDVNDFFVDPSGDPAASDDPSHIRTYRMTTIFSTSPATTYTVNLERARGSSDLTLAIGKQIGNLTLNSFPAVAGEWHEGTDRLWIDVPKTQFPELAAITQLTDLQVNSAFVMVGAGVSLIVQKDVLDTIENPSYTLAGSFSPLGASGFVAFAPAPDAVPHEVHIADATGDSFAGGLPVSHQDIEAGWFDHDSDYMYVGMKIADIPSDAATTTNYAYHVNFQPSWTTSGWGPATPTTFDALRVHASLDLSAPQTSHDFELQVLYQGATGSTYASLGDLPFSSIDPDSDIVWFVIPRLLLQSPPAGAQLTDFTADTAVTKKGVVGFTSSVDGVYADTAAATVPYYNLTEVFRPLVADSGGIYRGLVDTSIVLSPSISGGLGPYTCRWSTGDDGTIADPNACSTTVTFPTEGDKRLTFNVTDANGETIEVYTLALVKDLTGETIEFRLNGDVLGRKSVDTTDGDGNVEWIKTLDLTNRTGQQTLKATWFDADGVVLGMDSVSIVMEDRPAAFVTLTAPGDDTTVSGVVDVAGEAGHGSTEGLGSEAATAFGPDGIFSQQTEVTKEGSLLLACAGCHDISYAGMTIENGTLDDPEVPALTAWEGTLTSSVSFNAHSTGDTNGLDGLWMDLAGMVGARYTLVGEFDAKPDIFFFGSIDDAEEDAVGSNIGDSMSKEGVVPAGTNWAFVYMRRYDGETLGVLDGVTLTLTPPVSAPTSLTGTAAFDSASLAWSPPEYDGGSAISDYKVYRDGTLIATVPASTTTYDDTGLALDTFAYAVSAVNSTGAEGPTTAPLSLTTGDDTTPPSAVAELGVASTTAEEVKISWGAASDPETGISHYRITRSGVLVGTTTATNFTEGGLVGGTDYTYQVWAVNGQGAQGEKSSVVATTDDVPRPEIVSVYHGETLIGQATIDSGDSYTSWNIDWDTRDLTNGVYTLTAIYDDGRGVTDSASVDVEVDNFVPKPDLTIGSPGEGVMTKPPLQLSGSFTTTGRDGTPNGAAAEAAHPQLQDWLSSEWVRDTLQSPAYHALVDTLSGLDGYLAAYPSEEAGQAIVVVLDGAKPSGAPTSALGSVPIRYIERAQPDVLEQPAANQQQGEVLSIEDFEEWAAEYTGPQAPSIQQLAGPGGAIMMRKVGADGMGTFICTASYLFEDRTTSKYYLATAGHCLMDSGVIDSTVNPANRARWVRLCVADCINNYVGVGTYVQLEPNATYHPVTYARQNGIGDDFGLIEIPPEVQEFLRPYLWMWGGPTQFERPSTGQPLAHFGHGVGIGATFATQGRLGATISASKDAGITGAGWVLGGDSGSAVGTAFPRDDEVLVGDGASGAITHSIVGIGLPLFWSTDLEGGLERAGWDHLELVLEDDRIRAAGEIIQPPAPDFRFASPADGALIDPAKIDVVHIEGVASFENVTNDPGVAYDTFYLHRDDCGGAGDRSWMDRDLRPASTNCGSLAHPIGPVFEALMDNGVDLVDPALANVFPAEPLPSDTILIDTTRDVTATIYGSGELESPNALVDVETRLSYDGTIVAEGRKTILLVEGGRFTVDMEPKVDEVPANANLTFTVIVHQAEGPMFLRMDGNTPSNVRIPVVLPPLEVQLSVDDPTFAAENLLDVTGTESWSAEWDLRALTQGDYTLYARALVDGAVHDGPISRLVTLTRDTPLVPPTAEFTSTVTDLSVTFSDASVAGDGALVAWSWDFGDGTTVEGHNVSHTYTTEGTFPVTLTVTDDNGLEDSMIHRVTVERGVVEMPVEVRLVGPGGLDVVPWTNVGTPLEGEAGDWNLLWDPATDPAEGTYTVEVRMLKAGVPVATNTSTFVVDLNVAPVLGTLTDRNVEENSALGFTVTATDPDGDPITLSATGVPSGASFVDNGDGTGSFSWTPTNGDAGTYPVAFTASDGVLNDQASMTIVVFEEREPPVLDPIPDFTVAEGEKLIVPITGSDLNGDVLSLTVNPKPFSAVVGKTGDGSWSFVWTPGYKEHNAYAFTAYLTDGVFTVNQTFNVTVTDVDVAPSWTSAIDKSALVGVDSAHTVNARDLDGDVMTLTAAGLPSWATFVDHGGGIGRFQLSPPPHESGEVYTVTLTVSSTTHTTQTEITLEAFGYMELDVLPKGSAFADSAPGQTTTLWATVENTGNAGGWVTFSANVVRAGWTATPPGDIYMGPGETRTVSFDVVPGPSGSSSVVTLRAAAREFGNVADDTKFSLRIPVALAVDFASTSAVFGTTATVTATFLDGAPAAGVAITVTDVHQLGTPFVNVASGPTGADGTFTFTFDTNSPGGQMPGSHTLYVEGVRDARTETETVPYTVTV